MKICIWWPGKTKEPYFHIVQEYFKRIKRFHKVELKVFPIKKNLSSEQSKQRECEAMLKMIDPNDHLILLDETGKNCTSKQLTEFLERHMLANTKRIIFIIGGPYGFTENLYRRCQSKLSLSKMTFPHDMVRIIFLEQIYRAFTIKNNLPYHHN